MTGVQDGEREADVKARRGRCPRCGYSFRLRTDGLVQRHRLYVGSGRVWCHEARFLDIGLPLRGNNS